MQVRINAVVVVDFIIGFVAGFAAAAAVVQIVSGRAGGGGGRAAATAGTAGSCDLGGGLSSLKIGPENIRYKDYTGIEQKLRRKIWFFFAIDNFKRRK